MDMCNSETIILVLVSIGAVLSAGSLVMAYKKRKVGKCSEGKCCSEEALTLSTPVTLSSYEIKDLSLGPIIASHASSARHVLIDGVNAVEMSIKDYLNVLTQKVRQHDLEIADLAMDQGWKEAEKPKEDEKSKKATKSRVGAKRGKATGRTKKVKK